MKTRLIFIIYFSSIIFASNEPFKDLNIVNRNIYMEVDQTRVLKLERTPSTIYNSDDKVASYLLKDASSLYIKAKAIGTTDLILTSRYAKKNIRLHIIVGHKISKIKKILRETMHNKTLDISSIDNKIILKGNHANIKEQTRAKKLLQKLVDELEVVDMSKINRKHASPQINLRIRVVEMGRNVKRALGLNFGLNFNTSRTNIGFDSPKFVVPEGGSITKILVGDESSPGLLFGNFSLWSLLNIMSDENLITSLAEPNIILVPNEKASFLFGGEIPVNNAAGLGGTSAVDYRDYGIKIDAVAQILDNDFIRIKLSPSVSKVSDANSIVVNDVNGEFKIKGFITRKIDTTIELKSGQSIALAGLIESESIQSETHIPGLDKIPLVSDVTRHESVVRKETEIVFIVTPYLVKPAGNNDLISPVQDVNGLPKGKFAIGKPGFIIG